MAITVEEIKAIKPGTSLPFKISHPKEINVIRTLCSYVGTNYPELGVSYHTKAFRKQMVVIIEAREIKE